LGEREGNMMQCSRCKRAYYCSKACQKGHWERHKPNCLPPESSVHALFSACFNDLLPVPANVARDYGFDNMRIYHGDVLWGESSTPLSAEQILLGLYQRIKKDVDSFEMHETRFTYNSIGASKKMIVEAYKRNALDEFIHRYISNVFSLYGHQSPQYCLGWVWNRLVIGPTRTQGLTKEQVQKMRNEIYHKYYGSTNPANCCCVTLEQQPTLDGRDKSFLFYLRT